MILTTVSIIISCSLMLGGILMRKIANKPINETIGFRTHRAMLNVTNWHYANQKCGTCWLLTGAAGFALTMFISFVIMPRISEDSDVLLLTLSLLIQITAAVISAVYVERKLK